MHYLQCSSLARLISQTKRNCSFTVLKQPSLWVGRQEKPRRKQAPAKPERGDIFDQRDMHGMANYRHHHYYHLTLSFFHSHSHVFIPGRGRVGVGWDGRIGVPGWRNDKSRPAGGHPPNRTTQGAQIRKDFKVNRPPAVTDAPPHSPSPILSIYHPPLFSPSLRHTFPLLPQLRRPPPELRKAPRPPPFL
jgi:hypothetical protein